MWFVLHFYGVFLTKHLLPFLVFSNIILDKAFFESNLHFYGVLLSNCSFFGSIIWRSHFRFQLLNYNRKCQKILLPSAFDYCKTNGFSSEFLWILDRIVIKLWPGFWKIPIRIRPDLQMTQSKLGILFCMENRAWKDKNSSRFVWQKSFGSGNS